MTTATDNTAKRYSDLLTTSCMKVGADGRKIFYPWGIYRRGYAFPTNAAYERLNDLLKIYIVISLLCILPSVATRSYLAAAILFLVSMVFYPIWMRFELPRLQPTQDKLTIRGSYTNFARLLPAWVAWVELISCLVFVAGCVAVLLISPSQWMFALGGILFFGGGAVLSAVTLVLHRRPAPEQC